MVGFCVADVHFCSFLLILVWLRSAYGKPGEGMEMYRLLLSCTARQGANNSVCIVRACEQKRCYSVLWVRSPFQKPDISLVMFVQQSAAEKDGLA